MLLSFMAPSLKVYGEHDIFLKISKVHKKKLLRVWSAEEKIYKWRQALIDAYNT